MDNRSAGASQLPRCLACLGQGWRRRREAVQVAGKSFKLTKVLAQKQRCPKESGQLPAGGDSRTGGRVPGGKE
jgi:hypothetical protein